MLEIIKQKLLTYGQLERELSQTIYQLDREELGRSLSKITCKFVSNNLAIVIQGYFILKRDKICSRSN